MLSIDRNISFCKVPGIDNLDGVSEVITDKTMLLTSNTFEGSLEQLESILKVGDYALSHVKKSFLGEGGIFGLQLKNRFNYSGPDVLFSIEGANIFFHSGGNKQELCIHKNSDICMHIHGQNHLWE